MRLFFLVVLIHGTSIFARSQTNSIIGIWEAKDKNETLPLHLNANKTGTFDETPFTYEVNGNELEVVYESGTIHYAYELKGNSLTIKEGNLEHPYVFKRKSPSPEKAQSVGTTKNIDNRILGTWGHGTQSVQFLANGTMIKNGSEKLLFETTEGNLRIFAGNTMTESPYQVADSLLHIVLDGKIILLKR